MDIASKKRTQMVVLSPHDENIGPPATWRNFELHFSFDWVCIQGRSPVLRRVNLKRRRQEIEGRNKEGDVCLVLARLMSHCWEWIYSDWLWKRARSCFVLLAPTDIEWKMVSFFCYSSSRQPTLQWKCKWKMLVQAEVMRIETCDPKQLHPQE